MSTVSLTSALAAIRDIGRGRVFYSTETAMSTAPYQWDGTTELFLKWLCDTEGPVAFDPRMEFSTLPASELTGPGKLKAKVTGEDPQISLPAIYADPATRALLSPTGSASGGFSTWRPVVTFVTVIFAEELFYNATTKLYDLQLDTNGGTWLLGGSPLTGRKLQLFGLTTWVWSSYPSKAPFNFTADDHGLSVETVNIGVLYDLTKPEGHMQYTVGNPFTYSIDLEGGS